MPKVTLPGRSNSGSRPRGKTSEATSTKPQPKTGNGAKPSEEKTKEATTEAAKPTEAKGVAGTKAPEPNLQERMEGLQGWMAEIERKQGRITYFGAAGLLNEGVAMPQHEGFFDIFPCGFVGERIGERCASVGINENADSLRFKDEIGDLGFLFSGGYGKAEGRESKREERYAHADDHESLHAVRRVREVYAFRTYMVQKRGRMHHRERRGHREKIKRGERPSANGTGTPSDKRDMTVRLVSAGGTGYNGGTLPERSPGDRENECAKTAWRVCCWRRAWACPWRLARIRRLDRKTSNSRE